MFLGHPRPIFLRVAGNIVLLGGPLSLVKAVAKRKSTQAATVFGQVPRFPSLTFALTFSQYINTIHTHLNHIAWG